jgi:hypothetical protein
LIHAIKPIGKHYTDLPLPEEFIERILDTTIKVQNEGKSKTVEIPLEMKGKDSMVLCKHFYSDTLQPAKTLDGP